MSLYRILILLCLASRALAADPAPAPTAQATAPEANAATGVAKAGAAAPAAPPPAASRPVSLAANIHALRMAVEQQDANEAAAQRMTPPLAATAAATDPTSTDTLRSQLATSMSSLDNRCLGVNARATNGSVVLICGDNSGQISNTQTRTSTVMPLLLQPAAAPASTSGLTPAATAQAAP